jgi:hypothetical protein
VTTGRLPTMKEKSDIYTLVKTSEIDESHICQALKKQIPPEKSSAFDWNHYKPSKVYAWTVDLHPSPGACNIDIYRDIGVILHPEIDHHPYCEYYGVCASSRLQVFGIGKFASGFSLDPDHNVLKKEFTNYYLTQPEFQRIDTFLCSHPAANCELFEHFIQPLTHNKTIILFFTTRFEFGRNDVNINWRAKVIGKWNAWKEVEIRYLEWMTFVLKYYLYNRLYIVANNLFDVKYVEYFTGITPIYIPSWCGDLDGSYNLKNEWNGCELSDDQAYYQPIREEIIIVPYKQKLWTTSAGNEDISNPIYLDVQTALKTFLLTQSKGNCTVEQSLSKLSLKNCPILKKNIIIEHSIHLFTNHQAQSYKAFPAVIFIPYQTSVMTFFEIYRQNIPMFAPSLSLLIQWDIQYQVVSGRLYGWPKQLTELIRNYSTHHHHHKSIHLVENVPDPNLKYQDTNYNASAEYWLQFSDIYTFPHIILFDNWTHLVHLIYDTDLKRVSERMLQDNKQQRFHIMRMWDKVFRRAVPHRSRGKFQASHFELLDD